MEILLRFKPGISKRHLLYVAGSIWSMAGLILLYRAFHYLIPEGKEVSTPLDLGVCGGLLFYILLFSGISKKYIIRIEEIIQEKPCLFSFFSWKSYLIMGFMITMGISLSVLHVFAPHDLHVFFISMGLPLIFSGVRFFYHGIKFNSRNT